LIPPEIIAYIDSGRNPDIYTREFVELVQKGNATLKSRAEALGKFRDILAAEMRVGLPELREEVGKVLEVTGGAAAGEEIGEDVKEEGT
jgi:mediator of RNA polymerase II transcription subunit 10